MTFNNPSKVQVYLDRDGQTHIWQGDEQPESGVCGSPSQVVVTSRYCILNWKRKRTLYFPASRIRAIEITQ